MTAPKNPKPLGLPITIPAAQALANLEVSRAMDSERAARRAGTKVVMNALKPAETSAFGRPAAERGPNKAQRDAQAVHDSYMVGDTTPSKVDLSIKDMPGPMLLEVTDIDVYDHNPRIFGNEKIEDIEASLRANGFHDALVVTRRRVGDRYMLAAGSNTTLRVLQELWRSTQNEMYRWVNCIYQPFESETRLLAQHLGENLNRGDMKFWEVAKGMVELLDNLDREAMGSGLTNKPMGLREQADALASRGLRASRSSVALWRFAVQYLSPLGDSVKHLTLRGVQGHIQPRTTALRALAGKFVGHKISDEVFWGEIVSPTLAAASVAMDAAEGEEVLDAAKLCDSIEAALAERVGESVASVRQMLSMLKLSPELTLADLRMPSPNLIVGRGNAAGTEAQDEPQAPPAQSPLPLGPGQVRGQGANPPTSAAPRPAAGATRDPAATPSGAGPGTAPTSQQQTAAAPLFSTLAEADPVKSLHAAVEQLLHFCGLQDTLRWWDDMPMGFFIDMPDPAIHERRKVPLGSPEHEARDIKTVVWWSLVLMTGQFRDGCVPHIDHSSVFFRAYASDQSSNPLEGTDVDASTPDLDAMLMYRVKPGPMRQALGYLRAVEEAAAAMFEACPERWRRMLEVQRPSPT